MRIRIRVRIFIKDDYRERREVSVGGCGDDTSDGVMVTMTMTVMTIMMMTIMTTTTTTTTTMMMMMNDNIIFGIHRRDVHPGV